jgi:raffinose/stachyose/melibiose transport system permease protein
VGLANYKVLFARDPIFWVALRNNLLWTAYSLVFPVAIGLILALFLNEEFKGRTILRGIFYYPSILSLIAVGLIWRWMYHPNLGFLNALLERLGLGALAVDWLGDRRTALFATFIANSWQATGIVMVMFLSGLQTIPTEVYESARVEGAGGWITFWRITLPLLRETYIVVLAITMVSAMKVFDVIFSMTWGGPGRATEVLATYLYFNAYKYFKLGVGTAVSWVLLLLIALVVIPYVLYMSRRED